MREINTIKETSATNPLFDPIGSSVTQSGLGVIVDTENIAGSAGNTGVITSFVLQNTLSTVNETLNAVTLGVRHLTGGAHKLSSDAQKNWLVGGINVVRKYGFGKADTRATAPLVEGVS